MRIENNILKWSTIEIAIPEELHNKRYQNIFGTCTAGLQFSAGFITAINNKSVEVLQSNGILQAGYYIGEDKIKIGDYVYMREQIDPESEQIFWIIHNKEIVPTLNWFNIEYEDGTKFRVCPFTFRYKICQ